MCVHVCVCMHVFVYVHVYVGMSIKCNMPDCSGPGKRLCFVPGQSMHFVNSVYCILYFSLNKVD